MNRVQAAVFVIAALAACAAALSLGLYKVTGDTRAQIKQTAALEAAITDEREALRVLRAEWSYLNRPDRLHDLAGRHLSLAPVQAVQVGSFQTLPWEDPGRAGASLGRGQP